MTKRPEDEAAWLTELEDVVPLGAKKPSTPPAKPTPAAPVWQAPVASDWGAPPSQPPVPPLVVVSNTVQCIAGAEANGDPKLLKDLAVGKIPLTAQFDLHGWKELDGWQMLMNWLHEASNQDHRCVLVICGKGKGYGDFGDMGAFKSQIARILAHHPRVMAFHTALSGDGGSGALYVYLRRKRI